MYRVQSTEDYDPENQNMANLAGAMWYLHNEIVNNRWQRRYRKTRIQRFKITTQATQPLIDDGMNFGVRFAFDWGECTGPWNCTDAFRKYGYFVGCNKAEEFPTQQWKGKIFYQNASWYSLPGPCSSKPFWEHEGECMLEDPGGACDKVNGMGNCTYSYEKAGEISIDELEGISSFEAFAAAGGWEYNNQTDKGVHMDFWDDKYNASACDQRIAHASDLFRQKYAEQAELLEIPCDFNKLEFYLHVPQQVD